MSQNGLKADRILSCSSIIIASGSAVYFYQRISELEKKISVLEKIISEIVPLVDPKIGKNLQQCIQAIQALDSRIEKPSSLPKYTRITKPAEEAQVNKEEDDEGDEDVENTIKNLQHNA